MYEIDLFYVIHSVLCCRSSWNCWTVLSGNKPIREIIIIRAAINPFNDQHDDGDGDEKENKFEKKWDIHLKDIS